MPDPETVARTQIDRALEAAGGHKTVRRAATLRHAFTGRLVPQDPTNEPASALLDRLRSEIPVSVVQRRRRSSGQPLGLPGESA